MSEGMNSMTSNIFSPSEFLKRDVECIRLITYPGNQALAIKVLPKGLPGLVFQLGQDGSAIDTIATPSAQFSALPVLFLHGSGSEPSVMHFKKGPYTTIQVVFKPQALYTLFGLDAVAFSCKPSIHLGATEFGGETLETQLIKTPLDSERIVLLETFLVEKLKQSGTRDKMIEESLDQIHNNIGSTTVQSLLEQLNISERQFQKRFARVVGCSPKRYIRVTRVNEALKLMNSGNYERLSDVAYALNFYDQSHFIREMKTFSWVSPKNLTQKVIEFHQDQAGASYQ